MKNTTTLSLRIDSSKRASLDKIAQSLDRDRSYVINEAISGYLDTYDWQVAHIEKGLKEANTKQFATQAEVDTAFKG